MKRAAADRSNRIAAQLLRQSNCRIAAGILCDRCLFGSNSIGIIALLADQTGNVERCCSDSLNFRAAICRDDFNIVCAEFITGFVEADDIDVPDCDVLF